MLLALPRFITMTATSVFAVCTAIVMDAEMSLLIEIDVYSATVIIIVFAQCPTKHSHSHVWIM